MRLHIASLRNAVVEAAKEWRTARMAMIRADMKQDNRKLLNDLAEAEDQLSLATALLTDTIDKPT
jgi:hypothetical protein